MRKRWSTTEITVLNRLTLLGATQQMVGWCIGRTEKAVERKVAKLRTKFATQNYRDALVTVGYAEFIS